LQAACMPSDPRCDFDKLLRYMKSVMEQIVEADYTIVYLHNGLHSKNKPKLAWLKKVYGAMERKYRKNLKALCVVVFTHAAQPRSLNEQLGRAS
jgi:Rho GTPase-activating protein 1